jgi:hypothetical protein
MPSEHIIKTNDKLLFSKNILKNVNNNKNEINIKSNNIPFLYKIYKTLPARITVNHMLIYNKTLTSNLKDKIYSKMKELFESNTKIFKEYFGKRSKNNISKITHSSEIIYTLNENENCNIILTGDNHGSFHSFFRIILRLYIKGIIGEDYFLHLLTIQTPIFIKIKYIFIQYMSYIFFYVISFYCIIFFYHMNLLIFYNKKL